MSQSNIYYKKIEFFFGDSVFFRKFAPLYVQSPFVLDIKALQKKENKIIKR